MKKLIPILILSMVMISATASAAQEDALPEVGDVVEHFEVKEIRPYKAVDAQVVLFEHQDTGAQLIYIANDDINRTFVLTFLTNAIDDTGLPHVFEHATLAGSEKYPSKSLFFNLSYQTYNTYLNAATTDRITIYPVASLSEEQLLRYADYYTDSCLHPNVLSDESIFREEAWRYRMEDADSPLTIEGTVYSEMLGLMSLQEQAAQNFLSDAFPGSWIRYNCGGNPDVIPEMTFESLQAYHELYYHPSNCLAYLYGSFDDYAAFLRLLDEAFTGYEKKTFTFTDDGYSALEAPVENEWKFPVETDSDTMYTSSVYYGIIMPGLKDEDTLLKLDLLSSLILSESYELSQSMQSALPYAGLECYLELAGPDPAMVFAAKNVNPGDEKTFKKVIDETLTHLALDGIPQEVADAVMSSRVLSSRLRRESKEVGVNLTFYMAYNAAVYGDIWSPITLEEYEENIREWSADGTFAKLTEEYLTGDQISVLSLTSPQPGEREVHDAALAARLEEIKSEMSEEELTKIIEDSNAYEDMDDASEYIRMLQGVTTDTLPEELPVYELTDETDENGLRRLEMPAHVSEVGNVELMFDAGGLSLEQLRIMRLLTDMQNYLDTEKHSREELAVLQEQYFYEGRISYEVFNEEGMPHPYYIAAWISLTDDLDEGYDLAYELAFEQALDHDHVPQIRDALQALIADRKDTITDSPYSITVFKGLSRGNSVQAMRENIGNIKYYQFLQQMAMELDEDEAAVLKKLQEVRNSLKNRNGAVSVCVGDERSIAVNRSLADSFFAKLPDVEVTLAAYDFGTYPDSYALITDSNICFNGYSADFETLGLDGYDVQSEVVTALVSDQFLYPLLRDQYGAYGVLNYPMEDGGIYMVSYRDPNLEETYDVYAQLPELLKTYPVDQELVDGYILSVYSQIVQSNGELSDAVLAIYDHLNGREPERKSQWLQDLKKVTPETVTAYADVYQKLVDNGMLISAGGSGIIREHSDLFELIEAPFEIAQENAEDAETLTEAYADDEAA